MKRKGKKRTFRWLKPMLLGVGILLGVILIVLTLKFQGQALMTFVTDWISINVLVMVIIGAIVFFTVPRFRIFIMDTMGEGAQIQRRWYLFFLPLLLSMPFALYVLVYVSTESLVPSAGFSLVAIAPILGGLVLTAAGDKRTNKVVRIELISVAQKLIVATVMLIVFTCLYVTGATLGLLNMKLDTLDLSVMGFFRWALFWGIAWACVIGVYSFVFGIFDLVFVLRHLRR